MSKHAWLEIKPDVVETIDALISQFGSIALRTNTDIVLYISELPVGGKTAERRKDTDPSEDEVEDERACCIPRLNRFNLLCSHKVSYAYSHS